MNEPTTAIRADAEIVENRADGGSTWRLRLRVDGWRGYRAGQFAMLSPGPLTGALRWDPLLPRPMAIYRVSAPQAGDAAQLEVLYKVVGRGTALLAGARPGDRVRLVGPLGNGFPEPADGERAIVVGGGTGIASLFAFACHAAARAPVLGLLGASTAGEIMGLEDFRDRGIPLRTATEDGSEGTRGRVTDLLEAALAEPATSRTAGGPASDRATVYACGPTAMMRRCAEIAAARGSRCLVSLENHMACGFGVCLGCAAPLAKEGFALVCRDGPVFDASSIDWAGLP